MDRKVLDYVTAEATNERNFRQEIMKYINRGYTLYGSPFSGQHNRSLMLFQALVKYE